MVNLIFSVTYVNSFRKIYLNESELKKKTKIDVCLAVYEVMV